MHQSRRPDQRLDAVDQGNATIAVCWSVCCSQFADRCQLGDNTIAERAFMKSGVSEALGVCRLEGSMTHARIITLSAGLSATMLATFVAPESKADIMFLDGNELHRVCKSPSSLEKELCLGYIIGATEFLANSSFNDKRACFSENISADQVKTVVVLWLDQRPQHRHYTAASLTAAALSEAFPCKN